MSNHVTCLLLCLSFAALCLPMISAGLCSGSYFSQGMEDTRAGSTILDGELTSSSELPSGSVSAQIHTAADTSYDRSAKFARLNHASYWANNSVDPWLQIDLQEEKSIVALLIQGVSEGTGTTRKIFAVKEFNIKIGNNENTLAYVTKANGDPRVYKNSANGPDIGYVAVMEDTRYMRIFPTKCVSKVPEEPFIDNYAICVVRLELLGCSTSP